jgi:membrane protein implicated in regulation of membrane protease activity
MIIGAAATVLLLLAFLLDGLFDWMHLDLFDGAVGSGTVFAFLAVFGWAGAFTSHNTGLGFFGVVAIAALAGLIAGTIVGLTMRYLQNSESGFVAEENIVGKNAYVVLPIPAGGYGKIQVNNAGHLMEVSALSNTPISRGTQVVVEAITGPGVAKVKILED